MPTAPSPPNGDLAHQVEAQRVGAERVDHLERVEHVAQRLAHLAPVGAEQEAVDEHVLAAPASSAAISIAGQKTVWNLRMSLPMMWKRRRPEALGQILAGRARSRAPCSS